MRVELVGDLKSDFDDKDSSRPNSEVLPDVWSVLSRIQTTWARAPRAPGSRFLYRVPLPSGKVIGIAFSVRAWDLLWAHRVVILPVEK